MFRFDRDEAPVPGQVSPRLLKETAKQKIKNVIENVRYLCFRSTKKIPETAGCGMGPKYGKGCKGSSDVNTEVN
jgi:hypothetical protein